MRPAIIESPFKGADKAQEMRNRAYLEKCIRWCVINGWTPYASHKMLTDALDDNQEGERRMGMACGIDMSLSLLNMSDMTTVFFFVDYRMSRGMASAHEIYKSKGFESRCTFKKLLEGDDA